MTTEGAEAVRRNFLTGFVPGSGLPIFDPLPPEEAPLRVEHLLLVQDLAHRFEEEEQFAGELVESEDEAVI